MAKFIEVHNNVGKNVLINLDWVEYVMPNRIPGHSEVNARIMMAYHDEGCESDYTDSTDSYEKVVNLIANATGGICRNDTW